MSIGLLVPAHGGRRPVVDLALVPPERVAAPVAPEVGLEVVITDRRAVADDVVLLGLSRPDGRSLPSWEPGAHIDLAVGSEPVRAFSLCGRTADRDRWSVAIARRMARGGPWWAAEDRLPIGHSVRVSLPPNQFPLVDGSRFLFVAQGTGIAPIRPMITTVAAAGTEWRLLYLGESRSRMPFVDELTDAHPGRVFVHARDEAGSPDLAEALSGAADDCLVYCCGPTALVRTVAELCRDRPVGTFHADRALGPVAGSDTAGSRLPRP